MVGVQGQAKWAKVA